MSPAHHFRLNTLYFLIGLNVLLVFALCGVLVYATNVQDRVQRQEQRSYEACMRGNVLRELGRFVAKEPGSPVRATNPALVEQPCALIYPGGK